MRQSSSGQCCTVTAPAGYTKPYLRSFGGANDMATALRTAKPAVTIPHPLVILPCARGGWRKGEASLVNHLKPSLISSDLGFQLFVWRIVDCLKRARLCDAVMQ